jgi:AraC family L-rhamnose operon regulatory protein RhaS
MEQAQQRLPVEVAFKPSGLGLFESRHEEGFFMEWRRDPFPKILLVIGGEGILLKGRGQFAIQAGSLLVIPAMARHRIEDLPGMPLSLAGVCLRGTRFPEAATVRAACSRWRIETDSPPARKVRDWIREILVEERLGKPGADALQQALLVRILVELARTPARLSAGRVDSLRRVEAYIASMERDFWKDDSLDTISASLGLSRRRFTQLFREISGETWLSRLTRIRLGHAAELLRSTRLSVRSVAFECGYADLSHFYRVFKGQFGMSPGKRREKGSANG